MHQELAFLGVLAAIIVILLATCSGGSVLFLELHGPDGQAVYLNERAISSLRQPTPTDLRRYFPTNTKCVVVVTGGKFIATVETCQAIRDLTTPH